MKREQAGIDQKRRTANWLGNANGGTSKFSVSLMGELKCGTDSFHFAKWLGYCNLGVLNLKFTD